MSEAILQAREVSLSFAGLRVLQNISFSVPPGSIFSIIGPNGAGKSSLFNCISGFYRHDKGSILFKGIDLNDRSADEITRLGIGRSFQNIALFENLTVLENLLAGCHRYVRYNWLSGLLRLPGMVKEEIEHRQRVEKIIEFLDLERYRKYPISALPYGILKKVELGRALATRPELLLLDEPAAGLNQEEREQMASYILDIREQLGITQILIEHDLGFVMDLSQQVLALNFGTILTQGSPQEVARHPEVIRAYMGGGTETTVAPETTQSATQSETISNSNQHQQSAAQSATQSETRS